MDANSARLINVAKVPAHTKRKPYTRPAGPPLRDQLVSNSGMLMMNRRYFSSPIPKVLETLAQQTLESCWPHLSTNMRAPCHVPRTKQLKPNIDKRLKFRCEITVTSNRKIRTRPGPTLNTGVLPACLKAKLSLSSFPSELPDLIPVSCSSIGSCDWNSDSFAMFNVSRRKI